LGAVSSFPVAYVDSSLSNIINHASPSFFLFATHLVKALRPPLKFGAVLSSYGWGGGAIKHVQEILGPLKIEVVGAIEINGPPTEKDVKQIIELGKNLAMKIKEEG